VNNVNINSVEATYLKVFQLFLAKFCFHGMPVAEKLVKEPNFILKEAQFKQCPLQENGTDCGLFALITTLHLCHGINVDELTFTQSQVTLLRSSLYSVMISPIPSSTIPDPKEHLSSTFIANPFPHLRDEQPSKEDALLLWAKKLQDEKEEKVQEPKKKTGVHSLKECIRWSFYNIITHGQHSDSQHSGPNRGRWNY
jgi:hypothetical protein